MTIVGTIARTRQCERLPTRQCERLPTKRSRTSRRPVFTQRARNVAVRTSTAAVHRTADDPSSDSEGEEESGDESQRESGNSSHDTSDSSQESEPGQSPSNSPSFAEEEDELEEDEVQPAEAGVNGNSVPVGNGLTLADPDVLHCPICLDPLSIPVYQCKNGHLACGLCRVKINSKCPSCCLRIGYNRCRAMEKVLESIKVSCKNLQFGCTDKVSYSMKLHHEYTCKYIPCSCPYPGCEYNGISSCVYTHFAAFHSASSKAFRFNSTIFLTVSNNQKHSFLLEQSENTLFVLNHNVLPIGRLVNVVLIAPASSKDVFSYDLTATFGEISVNFRSSVDFMPKWIEGSPIRKYLIVPAYFANSNGFTELKLNLRKGLDLAYRG